MSLILYQFARIPVTIRIESWNVDPEVEFTEDQRNPKQNRLYL